MVDLDIDNDVEGFKKHLDSGSLSAGTINNCMVVVKRFKKEYPDGIEDKEAYRTFLTKYTQKSSNIDYSKLPDDQQRYNHGFYINHLGKFVKWKFTKNKADQIMEGWPKPKTNQRRNEQRMIVTYPILKKLEQTIRPGKHSILLRLLIRGGCRVHDIMTAKQDDFTVQKYEEEPVLKIKLVLKGETAGEIFIYDQELIKDTIKYVEENKKSHGFVFFDKTVPGFSPTKFIKIVDSMSNIMSFKVLGDTQIQHKDKTYKKNDIIDLSKIEDIHNLQMVKLQENFEDLCLEGKMIKHSLYDAEILDQWKAYLYQYRCFFKDLKTAMIKLGIEKDKIAFHDLRRTFCRYVYEHSNRDIDYTRKMMNHKRLETTLLYLGGSGEKKDKAYKDLYKDMGL